MSAAQAQAMKEGLKRYHESEAQRNQDEWAAYREFLQRDAESWATTGKGLSWAGVVIPRGSEHS